MDARRVGHHQRRDEPDEGLHAWVILACLAISALACFLLLRYTISMMSEDPSTPPPSVTIPAR